MNTNDFPTVTEVLAPFSNFEAISPAILDAAAHRGKIVHGAISDLLCSIYSPDEKMTRIPILHRQLMNEYAHNRTKEIENNTTLQTHAGFLKSFASWFSSVEMTQIIFLENRLESSMYGFQGTPDLVCQFAGDKYLTVIDWKTSAVLSKSWGLQLAGYSLLVENQEYMAEILAIRLKKDGSGFIVNDYTYQLTSLQKKFVGALNLYNHFYGNGEYISWRALNTE
jgi:hypothetical protein